MKQHLLFAISGLILNGFGLSLLGEAVICKAQGASWFWMGTLALVSINAGICLVIEAAKRR
ncbi:MAG: hypothetical protein AAF649_05500 [Verrucomicrobiota bacterium]